jgi:tRNA dimethylallyltransferase
MTSTTRRTVRLLENAEAALRSSGVVVIAGPTASGKSALAIAVAEAIGGEIVNFDSVQIYRDFDIGSAKPSAAERARVPHHLIGVVVPTEHFDAADFAALCERVCREIVSRERRPVLVGGTGFYLRAFLAGLPPLPPREEAIRERIRAIWRRPRGPQHLAALLRRVDPEAASRIATPDRHRIERALEVWLLTRRPISSWSAPTGESPERVPAHKLAISLPRAELGAAIDARVEEMFERGLVEETRALLEKYPRSVRLFGAIGYREALRVIDREISRREAISETSRRTRAYAKRQLTWLRAERAVHWIDGSAPPSERLAEALRLIAQQP